MYKPEIYIIDTTKEVGYKSIRSLIDFLKANKISLQPIKKEDVEDSKQYWDSFNDEWVTITKYKDTFAVYFCLVDDPVIFNYNDFPENRFYLDHFMLSEYKESYLIGFNADGKDDETEFDVGKYLTNEEKLTELNDLFFEFCKENNFKNVELHYIEPSH